jgi:hypothetical protein
MTEKPTAPTASASESDAAEEIVVCWRNPDGSQGSGRALRRENAEEMARIFSKMYPDQTYWLEPRKLTPPGSYGGVRRRKRVPPQR